LMSVLNWNVHWIGRAGQIINAILIAGFQVSAIGTVS
jgi:hypothetical protein